MTKEVNEMEKFSVIAEEITLIYKIINKKGSIKEHKK